MEHDVEKESFDVLVLGPGAFKGFCILGAVMYLSGKKIMDNVKCYVGVSVGALIALTLALDLNVTEICLKALELNSLLDDIGLYDSNGNIDIPRFISAILDNVGLTSSSKIREILSRIIMEKLGFMPTFQNFYQATGNKLVIVASNLNKRRVDVFDVDKTPDVIVLDAIMLSMNIPGIFYKTEYNGDVYIDGAAGNPYPVDTQDNGINRILGVYVETEHDPKTAIGYALSTIDFSMTQIRNKIIRESSERCKHIRIGSNLKDPTGVTIDFATKAFMIASGWVAAASAFDDKIVSMKEASLSSVPSLIKEIRGSDKNKIVRDAGLVKSEIPAGVTVVKRVYDSDTDTENSSSGEDSQTPDQDPSAESPDLAET